MVDLTVIILTKNEEQNIRKCIESFGDMPKAFLIVDSFSTDGTENVCGDIAKELSENGIQLDLVKHEFRDQADQFNWAIDNIPIHTEWFMRIDADEELLPELKDEIANKLPDVSSDINGIILRRRVYFMGRWIKHGGRYPEFLLRIIRNGKGRCEQRLMDEHMIISEGMTETFDNDLIDKNTKDLEWWTSKHNWYSSREVLDHMNVLEEENEHSDKADELEDNATSVQARRKRKIKNGGYYKLPKFFRAHLYFIYRYYIKLGFLDGTEGKIFCFLQAYWYRFLVDAKMYECEKTGNKIKDQGDLKA